MRIQITLKSGAQIEVEVEEFISERNAITGALNRLKWETPRGWTAKLHTVEMSEIAAIVALRAPGEWDEPEQPDPEVIA